MKPLDMRMSWLEAARIIAPALKEGSQPALEELGKMALAADLCRELSVSIKELVRLKAIKRRIEAKQASQAERTEYKNRKEIAWAIAEKLAGRIA